MRFIGTSLVALFHLLLWTGLSQADDPADIFEKRILPIFQAAKPSSCTECHLAGVDLKQYILPTQAETFAALLEMKLVDLDQPERSKILTFIARKPKETTLISDRIRQQEFEAFQNWIVAAVKDPALRQTAPGGKAGPTVPDEVIRHARKDRVLQSFIDNVWSEVGRCAACHSPDRNQEQVKKFGERVSWIKLKEPQGTLDAILDAGIVDTDAPETSLLLRKPTNQVEHGGGVKLLVGDRTYRQFLRFVEDYVQTVNGKYRTADQLPSDDAEVFQATEIWFKIEGVPAQYDQKLLRVDLYRQAGYRPDSWSADRWATADREVFGPKELWQNHLSLSAPRDSKRAQEIRTRESLPPGRYLARISIDREGKLASDPNAELGPDDVAAEIVVDSRWPAGYGNMTTIRFTPVRK